MSVPSFSSVQRCPLWGFDRLWRRYLNDLMLKVQLGVLGFTFLTSLWVLYIIDVKTTTVLLLPRPLFNEGDEDPLGFIVNTKGCRIPYMNDFDEEIKPFLKPEESFNCGRGGPLVNANSTHLIIDYNQLRFYNVSNQTNVNCCYRPFWRRPKTGPDNGQEYGRICIGFTNGAVEVDHEFVRVECITDLSKIFYKDFFMFFKRTKPSTEESLKLPENRTKLSVLMIGIDSISRLNLHRQMPQTLSYIRDHLSAVEYQGYNKIGENTFPNLVAILAGKTEEELTSSCWPTVHAKFDPCDFIWTDFKKNGYKTAYVEDSAWMGTFNYVKNGFYKQPTDLFSTAFMWTAEGEIGHTMKLNTKQCLGKRKTHHVVLNLTERYIDSTIDQLTFGLFWVNSVGHDCLNLPRQADDDYYEFFVNLKRKGVLDKSLVIFLSDHGIRWGPIRSTYQGYIEERLPFLFFIFPKWFKDRYSAAFRNLNQNQKKLTTPFDLHFTLKDLMRLNSLERQNLNERVKALFDAQVAPRGISLFLPISPDRTCETANISDDWCTCHESIQISHTGSKVAKAGEEIVNYLNKRIDRFPQCQRLALNRIVSARLELPASHQKELDHLVTKHDYKLIIEVKPSQGLFESIVREHISVGKYSVIGTVSRINSYGHQGDCMPFYSLRLYCFCG